MNKIKTFFQESGAPITAAIGLFNLSVYYFGGPIHYLVIGFLLLCIGLVDLSSDTENKDV